MRKEDGNVIPPEVKPGDRVLFGKYAGTDIVLGGEPYLILREEEVLGLLARPAKRTKAA
jgi:chaperonin GroES